jgi:hypothetical protein
MDINTIKTMVLDEPNNMKLGKKIRTYFMEHLELNQAGEYIYESPDGGDTVYRRRAGDHTERTKI